MMHARVGVMRALNRHVVRCLIRRAKGRIGESESWRAIDNFQVSRMSALSSGI
jgi:hypothetical protein